MNNLIRYTIILLINISALLAAQPAVNGRFVIVNRDSVTITVKFQMNTDTDTDTLGCSTIIFNLDTSSVSFPAVPVIDKDYNFINFTSPYYNSKITRPLPNQIWINIESLYENSGTPVAQSPDWTDVVQLNFNILNFQSYLILTWQAADDNWGIYNVDNKTLLKSGSWTNEGNIALPVELTSFSANILDNSKVKLNWQTATETNNNGFYIERSSGSNSQWEDMGFIKGSGQSTSINKYYFTDNNPIYSKSVYRLKQVDYQGTYKFSKEIEVDLTPKSFNLYQNYPNPFNPSTIIKFSLPYQTNVTIKIYDITGREITTLLNEKKDAGIYTINFSGNNLSSGVYLYSIICDNYTQIKKMLLLK